MANLNEMKDGTVKKFNEVKAYGKDHKKQIIIGCVGGALLIGGAYLIGKKVGAGSSHMISRQIGNVASDIEITQPVPLPKGVSEIWKQIDEDVFLDVASDIENALIDNGIDTLHIERSWEVEKGVFKDLVVEITKRTV